LSKPPVSPTKATTFWKKRLKKASAKLCNESHDHPTYSELMAERNQLKKMLEPREKESETKDNLGRLVRKEVDFLLDKKQHDIALEFFLRKELDLRTELERSQHEVFQNRLMLGVFEQREKETFARNEQFVNEMIDSKKKISELEEVNSKLKEEITRLNQQPNTTLPPMVREKTFSVGPRPKMTSLDLVLLNSNLRPTPPTTAPRNQKNAQRKVKSTQLKPIGRFTVLPSL